MREFGLGVALSAAVLLSPGLALAQTGGAPPRAAEQTGGDRFAAQVTSIMEGSPPAQLGRVWAEVVEEVRQRITELEKAAAEARTAGAAAPRRAPLPLVRADEPEVLTDEPGAGALITEQNEWVIRRWGPVQLFGQPIEVRERSTTFGGWEQGVLPGLGIRLPIP